jgi:hypothetical protein
MIHTEQQRDAVLRFARRHRDRLRVPTLPLTIGERVDLANVLEELIDFARGIPVATAATDRPRGARGA